MSAEFFKCDRLEEHPCQPCPECQVDEELHFCNARGYPISRLEFWKCSLYKPRPTPTSHSNGQVIQG